MFKYSNFGVSIEKEKVGRSGPEEYFLKVRVCPTAKSKVWFKFDKETFTDYFYDDDYTFSASKQFRRGRIKHEEGVEISESDDESLVHQTTSSDPMLGCHVYSEKALTDKEIEEMDNMGFILKYTFNRKYLDVEDKSIYMDEVTSPVEYCVISLRHKLPNFDGSSEVSSKDVHSAFERLFKLEDYSKQFDLENLYSDHAIPFYPAFSKFMLLIRFTEHSSMYNQLYKSFDPAYDCILDRVSRLLLDRKEDFSGVLPIDQRIYIATVSYLPTYFRLITASEVYSEVETSAHKSLADVLEEVKESDRIFSGPLNVDADDWIMA